MPYYANICCSGASDWLFTLCDLLRKVFCFMLHVLCTFIYYFLFFFTTKGRKVSQLYIEEPLSNHLLSSMTQTHISEQMSLPRTYKYLFFVHTNIFPYIQIWYWVFWAVLSGVRLGRSSATGPSEHFSFEGRKSSDKNWSWTRVRF